jgi:hypothetical protein
MVLMLTACLKPGVATAPEGTSATLLAYEVEVGGDGVEDAPEGFRTAMNASLGSVGVTANPLTVEGRELLNAHTPAQQLDALGAPEDDLAVVLRTEARFFSQLNGRFRWVVVVDGTVMPVGAPEDALTESFEVPVFLNFQHQDADDAIEAAAPVVDPKLRRMVTTVAAGL